MKRSVVCLLCVLTASADSVEQPAQREMIAPVAIQGASGAVLSNFTSTEAGEVLAEAQAIKKTVLSMGRGLGFNLGLML